MSSVVISVLPERYCESVPQDYELFNKKQFNPNVNFT